MIHHLVSVILPFNIISMDFSLCLLFHRTYVSVHGCEPGHPWHGSVLRRQMLCHMSSLLSSMEGARQTPPLPATAYGVQRVARRAGEAVVSPVQPSPPYGHLRPAP